MAKDVRIHLTPAQLSRINSATGKTPGVISASRAKVESSAAPESAIEGKPSEPANPDDASPLADSTDLDGPGAKMTDSGKPRPTAVIPLP